MESPDLKSAEAQLHAAGHKLTPQRRAVLEVFFSCNDHLTAQQVHALITASRPNVSLVTVYRTLELLTSAGILTRLNLNDGADRYERSAEHGGHHHHILCTRCGAVAEFDDCLISSISRRLEQNTGFRVTDHWMEMSGLCAQCKHNIDPQED